MVNELYLFCFLSFFGLTRTVRTVSSHASPGRYVQSKVIVRVRVLSPIGYRIEEFILVFFFRFAGANCQTKKNQSNVDVKKAWLLNTTTKKKKQEFGCEKLAEINWNLNMS